MLSANRFYRLCGSKCERMLLKQVFDFSLTTPMAWSITAELKPFPIEQLSRATFWLTKKRVLQEIRINNQIDGFVLRKRPHRVSSARQRLPRKGSRWSVNTLARLLATLRYYPEFEPLKLTESDELFGYEYTKGTNNLLRHREGQKLVHLALDVNPGSRPSKAAKKIQQEVIDLAANPVFKNSVAKGLVEFSFCTVTRFRGNIVKHYLKSLEYVANIPFRYVVVPEILVVHGATYQLFKQFIFPPDWLFCQSDQSSRSRSGGFIEQP